MAASRTLSSKAEAGVELLGWAAADTRAAEKLRRQESHAGKVMVFFLPSPFRKREVQHSRFIDVPLRWPCADTADVVSTAILGLHASYQPGISLSKVGVMLMDLLPAALGLLELDLEDDAPARDRGRLMQEVDVVNDLFGTGKPRIGLAKPQRIPQGSWERKLERRTLA